MTPVPRFAEVTANVTYKKQKHQLASQRKSALHEQTYPSPDVSVVSNEPQEKRHMGSIVATVDQRLRPHGPPRWKARANIRENKESERSSDSRSSP